MSWNYAYTKRKQKEMTDDAVSDSTKKTSVRRARSPHYNIYSELRHNATYKDRMQKEQRRDKIIWTTGYIVIALLTIVFVCCLVWLV